MKKKNFAYHVEFGGFACEEEMRSTLRTFAEAFNNFGENSDKPDEEKFVGALGAAVKAVRDNEFGKSADELSQYEKRMLFVGFVLGKAMVASKANIALDDLAKHAHMAVLLEMLSPDKSTEMYKKLLSASFSALDAIRQSAGELIETEDGPESESETDKEDE